MKRERIAIAAIALSMAGAAFAHGNKATSTTTSSNQDQSYSTSTSASADTGSTAANDQDQIRQAQQALNDKGFNTKVDGQLGPNTKKSLKSFQKSQGLQANGSLDQPTILALGIQQGGSSQASDSSAAPPDPDGERHRSQRGAQR